MTNACCVWDFTVGFDFIEFDDLKNKLKENCKKYCFQLELSENEYKHYQGRISLKRKVRLTGLKKLFVTPQIHWSITSNENKSNMFYVCKDDTRINGPWKDTDIERYIPRQIREIESLYPWQQNIVDNYDRWDTRTINILYCPQGNIGKTTLVGYMRAHGLGFKIPFCNNFKDILRIVCDVPTYRCYLMDMPRAISKENLAQLYSAIEDIKNGYAYDDRYKFKEKHFDCPNIWLFTNILPQLEFLSLDRWKLWEVIDYELKPLTLSFEECF